MIPSAPPRPPDPSDPETYDGSTPRNDDPGPSMWFFLGWFAFFLLIFLNILYWTNR